MLKLTLLSLTGSALAGEFLTVKEPVADSYIVKFANGYDTTLRASHMAIAQSYNLTTPREYTIGTDFVGYQAVGDMNGIKRLVADHPEIEYVEQDMVVRAFAIPEAPLVCETQTNAEWGLARTSDTASDKTYQYQDDMAGQGVLIYIADTGVRISHSDFNGRARFGWKAQNSWSDSDSNGHGTHCASTAAGKTYGIAKEARIIAVKVLGDDGSGSTAGVLGGIDWAAAEVTDEVKVISMSLGGGKSSAMESAVTAATSVGVHVSVASGNESQNACNVSPAGAGGAGKAVVTVNAIQNGDRRSSFSNYGTCTDVFAPGSAIKAAWMTSDTATNTISGTSMACPHVTGVLARRLSESSSNSYRYETPLAVKKWITDTAFSDVVSDAKTGSPNKLLKYTCSDK